MTLDEVKRFINHSGAIFNGTIMSASDISEPVEIGDKALVLPESWDDARQRASIDQYELKRERANQNN
jgi:hypothetical protein